MKKIYILFTMLLLFGCTGCYSPASDQDTSNISAGSEVEPVSLPYTVNDVIKPEIIDESSQYTNIELTDLNKNNNYKPITEVYFLDNENIIFSVPNEKKDADASEACDLYKYNFKSKVTTVVCQGFVLYCDCNIRVKDFNNFSIIKNGLYLKIENNEVKIKRNLFKEIKDKYPLARKVYYNEENNKVIIFQEDIISKTNVVFITESDFSIAKKLPFENVYRVQWADKNNVLVAYKDSNNELAKYNLSNGSIVTTTLPKDNYFIDPVISDNGIIRFLYLNDSRKETPWGFLDLNKGSINRVCFESCNPTSIVRNARMAGFFESDSDDFISRLFLYDNHTENITVRNNSVELPQALAVSPDGKTILFVSGNLNGESKFYINKKSE